MKTQNPPRKRVQLHCPEESITDQEHAREFSMAAIKQKMEKGIPPTLTNDTFYSLKPLKYTNLQDAINFQQDVIRKFESLPTEIRQGMGNNIQNFETYLSDPQNHEKLKKYGLIQTPDTKHQELIDAIKLSKEPNPLDPDTFHTQKKTSK